MKSYFLFFCLSVWTFCPLRAKEVSSSSKISKPNEESPYTSPSMPKISEICNSTKVMNPEYKLNGLLYDPPENDSNGTNTEGNNATENNATDPGKGIDSGNGADSANNTVADSANSPPDLSHTTDTGNNGNASDSGNNDMGNSSNDSGNSSESGKGTSAEDSLNSTEPVMNLENGTDNGGDTGQSTADATGSNSSESGNNDSNSNMGNGSWWGNDTDFNQESSANDSSSNPNNDSWASNDTADGMHDQGEDDPCWKLWKKYGKKPKNMKHQYSGLNGIDEKIEWEWDWGKHKEWFKKHHKQICNRSKICKSRKGGKQSGLNKNHDWSNDKDWMNFCKMKSKGEKDENEGDAKRENLYKRIEENQAFGEEKKIESLLNYNNFGKKNSFFPK